VAPASSATECFLDIDVLCTVSSWQRLSGAVARDQ
jgi:hypothetical protein